MGNADSPDLLRSALTAAARFRVIPLCPRGKTPAIGGWQGRATQVRRTIHRWWEAVPSRNIGVCTGRGLLVVDLDVPGHDPGNAAATGPGSGANGLDELRRLARAHDDDSIFGPDGRPRTYTVETPSAGLHLYFRVPDPACCRNTQGALAPLIDTRGAGGFVVGAGSLGPGGRRYRAVVHRPIAPVPAWLLDALRPPSPARRRPAALPAGRAAEPYVEKAVRDECATVTAATPGGRNAALLRAARILGEFVGAGALDETTATDELLAAAADHLGVEGFTEQEAVATIRSGLGYGRQRPRERRPGPRSPRPVRPARPP